MSGRGLGPEEGVRLLVDGFSALIFSCFPALIFSPSYLRKGEAGFVVWPTSCIPDERICVAETVKVALTSHGGGIRTGGHGWSKSH